MKNSNNGLEDGGGDLSKKITVRQPVCYYLALSRVKTKGEKENAFIPGETGLEAVSKTFQ